MTNRNLFIRAALAGTLGAALFVPLLGGCRSHEEKKIDKAEKREAKRFDSGRSDVDRDANGEPYNTKTDDSLIRGQTGREMPRTQRAIEGGPKPVEPERPADR